MNPIRSLIALFAAGCLTASLCTAQATQADAEKDVVLKAMLTELGRSTNKLQLAGFEKPFFIQYRIQDVDNFETRASFGASWGRQRQRGRIVFVTVKIGSYKTDSSGGSGESSLQVAALENDPIALRSTLWSATDDAYKSALADYASKEAQLKQVETPPQADDFSHEKPTISLADPISLVLDENAWTSRVAHDSGIMRANKFVNTVSTVSAMNPPTDSSRDLQYSVAQFRARATTTWLVNSEGAIVRKSIALYQESIAVGTQADDGMGLDRSYATQGNNPKDLDSPTEFEGHVTDLLLSLVDLRKAPVVEEEYHGPVLFSADASSDILRELVGASVLATRPRLGTDVRTNGPFASSYHARVLPDFLNVVDNPGISTFNGKGLVGAYDIDDEGVPAQAVSLITAGKLENYLIGRQPVRDFLQSNGHGRAGIASPSHPSTGVLKITASNGLSDDAIHDKLVAMGKDRGLKNVYFVQTLGQEMMPRLLYRIGPDGKGELVRGASLDDIDERAMRSNIEAAGKDLWLGNYVDDVPDTVLAPALLFSDATIRRANEKSSKLPFYPPPPASK